MAGHRAWFPYALPRPFNFRCVEYGLHNQDSDYREWPVGELLAGAFDSVSRGPLRPVREALFEKRASLLALNRK